MQKKTTRSKIKKATQRKDVGQSIATSSTHIIHRIGNSKYLPLVYAIGALGILLLTVVWWSVLSARVQQSNADQLVNAYLFKDTKTFQGAIFPDQHTQLIKWPLFLLVRVFGFSVNSFIILTMALVVGTVACFVALLRHIERRPLVFGTLCLALTSALLLVPAQPYAGALLPVNMAMLTTRNIEYILYVIGLLLIVKSSRVRCWQFWVAVIILALLIASDKLFLTLSLGGALVSLVMYGFVRRWEYVTLSVHWLLAGIFGTVAGIAVLKAINLSHLTHITTSAAAGPYTIIQSVHSMALGIAFGGLNILTNFGANPGFDSLTFHAFPHNSLARLFSISGFTFICNFLIFGVVIFAIYKVLRTSLVQFPKNKSSLGIQLSVMLIVSSIIAIGAFVLSNHYYPVDSRYVTILLFTGFITIAAYLQTRKHIESKRAIAIGSILIASTVLGIPTVLRENNKEAAALATINARNATIVAALEKSPTTVLLGDYWRVIPIKSISHNTINVTPLADCSLPRGLLTSAVWQPDIQKHSFAYLLSSDLDLTDYPHCSLSQVIQTYGRPNASILIAGTLTNPQERLLLYNKGRHTSGPATTQASVATVTPITLDELPISCQGPTIMSVVAHQDDDLLFMNPDLLHDIKAGYCTRTIYMTAGDDGQDKFYWLSRENGSMAAYSKMIGTPNIWIQRIVKLADNEFIVVANPRGDTQHTVIFLHLPDGNLRGNGFKDSHYESLAKLESGKITTIHAVDGQSSYTKAQIINTLSTLMNAYSPFEIYTQSTYKSIQFTDHADHVAVGQLTKRAYDQYEQEVYNDQVVIPIRFYMGYPGRLLAANVHDGDLQQKMATFLTYAQFDGSVCHSIQVCNQTPTYGAYLTHQYQNPY